MKIFLAVLLLSALSFGQATLTDAQQRDCSNAIKAVDRNVKKKGPDPTSSRSDLNALLEAMHRACKPVNDYVAARQTGGLLTAAEEQPSIRDNETKIQESQPAADMHELLAQRTTGLNREIALGNRLIAHLQKAQTWEGIDADHPEAVALREKIAQEEKECVAAVKVDMALAIKIDVPRAIKECSADEISQYTRLVKEATAMDQDASTQQERYHALGY